MNEIFYDLITRDKSLYKDLKGIRAAKKRLEKKADLMNDKRLKGLNFFVIETDNEIFLRVKYEW